MSHFIDITGQTFGRLTALSWERTEYANRMQIMWTCECVCGKIIRATVSHLRRGNPKSCGCWNDEETAERSRTHGLRRHPLYSVWAGILARCENPDSASYKNYGDRGITVCVRWHDFAAFYADMGERPSPGHQVDRIDNDLGYWCGKPDCPECGPLTQPSNCQWSTREKQGERKRNNKHLSLNGRTMTVAMWSRALEIPQQVLHRRMSLGWSDERVLAQPYQPRIKRK